METTQRFSKLFHLLFSKEAPVGTKAKMSEDAEKCLPRLKGRQCHLETFCDRIRVFSPANVQFWSKKAPLILIPNDSKSFIRSPFAAFILLGVASIYLYLNALLSGPFQLSPR